MAWSRIPTRLVASTANTSGNLVDEITGIELTPAHWGADRVINGIVPGISGEYSLATGLFY
jgi:hypothetical protein